VRHHDFIRLVPMQVQRRLAYLVGDPQLPAPRLDHVARTIDDAADAYAGIIWSITNGVPWSSLSLPLENLCRFYGDIPGVASLVIKCARFATPGTFPWLAALTPNIQVALCLGYSFNEFELVNNAQQARGVMPLIEQLYPGICADCRAGKVFDGDWDPQRKTIDRIWHLGHPQ
jgi:hypothetical protein